MTHGLSIHITGIVQGVGFRPFIYNLAARHKLTGWVKNTSAGVDILVDGSDSDLRDFLQAIERDKPPLALINRIESAPQPASGFESFTILQSESIPSAFQPISPDVATCPDCLLELNDPADRRYRYPFINCTNCGPRFTIIQDIPYDRPLTTMSGFKMCPDCEAEYTDPANRRFHAQPIACPKCGPKIWLEEFPASKTGRSVLIHVGEEGLQRARKLLTEGKIVAIKGLGGFHLACDASNPAAVAEMRYRKLRVDKPFALMMPDLETVKRHCQVSPAEAELLQSPARPIVLLRRRPESTIAHDVAPGQNTLGVMLPYTPLHHLLFFDTAQPSNLPTLNFSTLVLTSGNLSDEPICTDNIDARTRLAPLADAFLMHDRDIHIRTDDSVVRVLPTSHSPLTTYPLRRSRGYSPFPVQLPWDVPPILATGAELKNTFCITNGNYAFLSHHIGDLENYETLQSFEQGVAHFEKLFRVSPVAVACDLHPNYLSTRYALERSQSSTIQPSNLQPSTFNLPTIQLQHHHAHIAALMAEHGLDGSHPVIGVAFDGTGYGTDGAIWGGEFLVVDYSGFERAAHMQYFPLPGGDAATRRPSRTALGLLYALGIDWDDALPTHADLCYEDRTAIRAQLEHNINSPLTSSMGRLFDAAAALAGVRQQVNYEAQAAIEFEVFADPDEGRAYPFDVGEQVNPKAAIEALIADSLSGVPLPKISARFHNGLAQMVLDTCITLSEKYDLSEVALSGGVWQNSTLLTKTLKLLEKSGFTVYIHHQVPANDGGLALGQAAIAGYKLKLAG